MRLRRAVPPRPALPGQCGSAPRRLRRQHQCGTCTLPDDVRRQRRRGLSECGIPATCTGLCLQQQVACGPDGGVLPDGATPVTTTVTGTVYAPNGVDPLPNVLVYIPNAPVQPFTPGVACEHVLGGRLRLAARQRRDRHDGNFTLQNVPVGTNIPLVIQTGRWRRQTVIPSVAACTNTALPTCTAATAANGACLTSLPQTQAQGDIPLMAFATGSVDALECVMLKIGVAAVRVHQPRRPAAASTSTSASSYDPVGGRHGARRRADRHEHARPRTSSSATSTTLEPVRHGPLPVRGRRAVARVQSVHNQQTKASTRHVGQPLQAGYQSNVIDYANAGGRIFATHYSYIWLYNDAPVQQHGRRGTRTMTRHPATTARPPRPDGLHQHELPQGARLAEWLQNIGASTTQGQIPLNTLRWDIDATASRDRARRCSG